MVLVSSIESYSSGLRAHLVLSSATEKILYAPIVNAASSSEMISCSQGRGILLEESAFTPRGGGRFGSVPCCTVYAQNLFRMSYARELASALRDWRVKFLKHDRYVPLRLTKFVGGVFPDLLVVIVELAMAAYIPEEQCLTSYCSPNAPAKNT